MARVRREARTNRLTMLLAGLAVLVGLLAGTSAPASAWTAERFPDHVVLTSARMESGPVFATMIVDYRNDGTYTWTVNSHWGWIRSEAKIDCTIFLTREHIPLRVDTVIYGSRRKHVTDTGASAQPSPLLKQHFSDLQDGFDATCRLS